MSTKASSTNEERKRLAEWWQLTFTNLYKYITILFAEFEYRAGLDQRHDSGAIQLASEITNLQCINVAEESRSMINRRQTNRPEKYINILTYKNDRIQVKKCNRFQHLKETC